MKKAEGTKVDCPCKELEDEVTSSATSRTVTSSQKNKTASEKAPKVRLANLEE